MRSLVVMVRTASFKRALVDREFWRLCVAFNFHPKPYLSKSFREFELDSSSGDVYSSSAGVVGIAFSLSQRYKFGNKAVCASRECVCHRALARAAAVCGSPVTHE